MHRKLKIKSIEKGKRMKINVILLKAINLAFVIAFLAGIVIYLFPILLFSIIPNVFGNSGFIFDIWNESKDKLGHFIYMGLCAFLINFLLKGREIQLAKASILLGNFILMVFITLDEVRHLFIKSRDFELLDLFSGFAGILIFGHLAAFIVKKL